MKRTILFAAVFVVTAASLASMASAQIIYFNMRGSDNNFYVTDEIDFVGNSALLSTAPTVNPTFAMDANADGTKIYAIEWTGPGFGPIWELDVASGSVNPAFGTLTGPIAGSNISGLSYNAADGIWYLISIESGSTFLYSGDITTGVFTVVGSLAVASTIDISIDADGNCYGHSLDDNLYSVDLTTGLATLIGPTGQPANFAQGMDFCPNTGVLYATVYTGGGTGVFGWFDLGTGFFNVIQDTTPLNAEMEMVVLSCEAAGPICADSGFLVIGASETGSFEDVCDDDEVYWSAQSQVFAYTVTDPPVIFELSYTATTDQPTALSFDVNASKSSDNTLIFLRGLIWDFDAQDWVGMGQTALATADATTTYVAPDPLGRFVGPNNEVRLRLAGLYTQGLPNTKVQIDQAVLNSQ